jgi:general secretion pathway protein D
MKKSLVVLIVIVLALAAVSAEAKIIKKSDSIDEIAQWLDGIKVSLVARGVPIADAARLLPCSVRFEDVTGLNETTVTASLHEVSLREALDAITHQVGFGYEAPKKGVVKIYQFRDLSYTLPVTPVSENYSTSIGSDDSSSSGDSGDGWSLTGLSTTESGSSDTSSQGNSEMSLSHSSNVSIWTKLKENLDVLIGDQGKAVVDPRSSMVFVRCPASIAGAVDNYMQAMLDALLVSVQVEITIIDVTDYDNRELGMDWDLVLDQMSLDKHVSIIATGASSFLLDPVGSPFNFSISRPHGDRVQSAVVKALRDYAKVRVVEQTTLSLRNNTAATIRRGTNRVYIESISMAVTTDISQTSVEKSNVLSGVDIGVMANVYKDDLVSLSLTPNVCQLLSMESVEAGDTIVQNPETRIRENLIQVLLKNRQTAMIVGAKSDKQGYEGRGIPGLSRLPVFGALFGDKATYDESGYIVVLVTPHVVRPGAI